MWAVLDVNNQVIDCAVGEDVNSIPLLENTTLIEMTHENSPATMGGFYNKETNTFYIKE